MSSLIGREPELASVTTALRRPDLAGVFLVGEAGIGKTHLLDAAMRLAADAGFVTTRVAGDRALADLPLAAFSALLPDRPSGDAGDLVTLRRSLRELAGDRPLVVAVDDAHLLDDASAATVHQLAADLTAFVIGTVRSGEAAPAAITALWKDRLVDRVEVGPLPRAALAEYAAAVLDAEIEPRLDDELWRRSAGNPLFARELLLAARDNGSITLEGERFTLVSTLPAPTTVTELLGARLATLDDDERRAVDLVALGGVLDVDVLERLVDPEALVRLEAARLLVAEEHGTRLDVRFEHPVHADAVRQSMGRIAARRLRRELADALEVAGGTGDDLMRIVTLRLDAGATSPPALVLRASDLALQRHDLFLAERLAQAAFDQGPDADSAIALAGALVEQGRHDEANTVLAVPELDLAGAGPERLVRLAVLRSTVAFWGLGRADDALDWLAASRAQLPDAWHTELDAAAAAIEAARGRPDRALELAPPGGAAAQLPLGTLAVVTALSSRGLPARALAEATLPADDVGPRAIAASSYAFALIDAGRAREAADLAIDRYDAAVRANALRPRVAWAIVLGWIDLRAGRNAAARRWFDEAAHLAALTISRLHSRRWAIGGGVLCAALAGDVDTARTLLAQLDELPPHDAVVHELLGRMGRAWTIAAAGDADAAAALLGGYAREAAAAGLHAHTVQYVAELVRINRPRVAKAVMAEVGELHLDGALLPVMRDALVAIVRNDSVTVADATDHYVAAGATVLAAENAAAAWIVARTQNEDPARVAELQRRAVELRAPLAELSTPGLAATPPDTPLSRREQEIATLVAEGRTSREVAAELVIGVRTVESHLARVFDKLGIRSRAELADALRMRGLDPVAGGTHR